MAAGLSPFSSTGPGTGTGPSTNTGTSTGTSLGSSYNPSGKATPIPRQCLS